MELLAHLLPSSLRAPSSCPLTSLVLKILYNLTRISDAHQRLSPLCQDHLNLLGKVEARNI